MWYGEGVEIIATCSDRTPRDNKTDSEEVFPVHCSESPHEDTTKVVFMVTEMWRRCEKYGDDKIFALTCVYFPVLVRCMRHLGEDRGGHSKRT